MNKNWPTEVLIQQQLDLRKSIRLQVVVRLYNSAEKGNNRYKPIETCFLEVGTPGLVWRIVANVVQSLKRLEVELEHEENSNENWIKQTKGLGAQPHPGDERYQRGGRPRKDGTRSVRRGQADSGRQDPDAGNGGTSEGSV